MPQMSPIMWSMNLIYILLIFYLFISCIYFNFFKIKINKINTKMKNHFKWNW